MITRESKSLIGTTGATFSDCERYRYKLWRIWDESKGICMFLMLNPSTADDIDNDATVERCERRARQMGYGGLVVCNLFAFRSTDPAIMKGQEMPKGVSNDAAILEAAREAEIVICAWGGDGKHMQRSNVVRDLLRGAGIKLHYLRMGSNGEPWHPLYVPYSEKPKLWDVSDA